MNTIDSTKLIELANADYELLKEKGKEGEKVLHYNGYLDGFARGLSESQSPWHKVSEGLPEEEAFLVRKIDNPQVYAVLIYSHEKKGFWNAITGGFNTIDGVLEYYTHWMYIPEIKEDQR